MIADVSSKAGGATELVVARDQAFAGGGRRFGVTAPVETAKDAGSVYRSVNLTADGLEANAVHYYRLDVDGVAGAVQSLRTAPAQLVPADFSYIIGSCNEQRLFKDFLAYNAMAGLDPGYLHINGDIVYTDIVVDDITQQRARNVRVWKQVPAVAAFIKKVAMFGNPDNHDSAGASNYFDTYAGTTYQKVVGNSLKAFMETFPLPPLAAARRGDADIARFGLAYSYPYAHTYTIVMDTNSFRTPTAMLGADQLQWVIDELQAAAGAGYKRINLISSENLGREYLGWQASARWAAELARILNVIRLLPVAVTIFDGDLHFCGFAFNYTLGTLTPGLTLARVSASAIASIRATQTTFDAAAPHAWPGKPADHRGNEQQFVRMLIAASGEWTAEVYGEPYSGSTGTLLSSRSSTDQVCAVEFASAPIARPAGRAPEISVTKSWFGPVNGCSVAWSTSDGQSGRAAFGPNNGLVTISPAAPASGSITVELRDPSNCTLGGRFSLTLSAG